MANRLARKKIDEMWSVYQERRSIREVAKKCAVHHKTVERYRLLERWDERLAEIQDRARAEADYDLATAMADSLRLVRAYKQKVAAALESKTMKSADVTAAELERVIKLEAFVLGGAENRTEIVGRFEGWSDEELERYAGTGELPTHASNGAS